MKESDIKKVCDLLDSRRKRLDQLKAINKAKVVTISSGVTDLNPIVSLGKDSPLRPFIVKAFEDAISSIESEIATYLPNIELEDHENN
jgi:hypothetical protein